MASFRGRITHAPVAIADRAGALPVIGTALAVQKRYSANSDGFLAAGITYYGFLSLFPLLLLALSGLGYALASNPQAQADWTRRISESLPGLGDLVGDNLSTLVRHRTGTGIAGIIGLAWSGRGVAAASSHALALVHRMDEKSNFLLKQVWMIGALIVLGSLAIVSTAVGTAVGGARLDGVSELLRIAGALLAIGLDFLLFLAAYRILTMRRGPALKHLWPGALLAAIGWTTLKLAGGWYATRTVTNAQAVYGTFATTIGVLVLLYLAAQLFMYGAELNAVLIDAGGARDASSRQHGSPARVVGKPSAIDHGYREGDRRRYGHTGTEGS